jgi:hypothetical protein
MTIFETNISICDKSYEAQVVGDYHKYEPPTWDTPEVQASFNIQQILIIPNNTVGEINLMSYQYEWLIDNSLLEDLEKDYFNCLKREDYE